ncbi:hypothetical protein J5226_01155 [Lysobacter sp. K5869]|uniref:hypothetical protein n=1 Tax=Lysobacter sp. K5869 TaxID=2820808 RepID=UPI001C061141|nr:hypothetical protein [Lysobacter sp. K5869]QWP77044.1 hypothetical protein J5226_01155 [Lysobacter sp. K5869]
MRKTSLCTAALTAALTLASASAAHAGTPSGPYALFKYCPYTDPMVGSCVVNTTTSGTLKIGSTTMPIDKPIVMQGGIENIGPSPFYAAVGAPTLQAPPAKVPGGLLGIVNPAPDWPGPLWTAFWAIIAAVNDVSATIEPVQPVQTNFGNALFPPTDGSDPTVARLAVRVHLQNPFLGGGCYIGSAQDPIVLKLQTGTTAPPPPNQPISGNPGTAYTVWTDEPNFIGYLQVDGNTLVDNSFAVPKARGCGNIALGLPIITQVLDALVSGAVNLKVGLPAAAGTNTAIMTGKSSIAAAQYVLDSER